DDLMARYYPLLLGQRMLNEEHPLQAKKHLAFAIVETYHSRDIAQQTLDDWNTRFSEKRLDAAGLPNFQASESGDLVSAITKVYADVFKVTKSRAEASRLIKQGSVQLDGEKLLDPKAEIPLRTGQILRLDKTHAVRIG